MDLNTDFWNSFIHKWILPFCRWPSAGFWLPRLAAELQLSLYFTFSTFSFLFCESPSHDLSSALSIDWSPAHHLICNDTASPNEVSCTNHLLMLQNCTEHDYNRIPLPLPKNWWMVYVNRTFHFVMMVDCGLSTGMMEKTYKLTLHFPCCGKSLWVKSMKFYLLMKQTM